MKLWKEIGNYRIAMFKFKRTVKKIVNLLQKVFSAYREIELLLLRN